MKSVTFIGASFYTKYMILFILIYKFSAQKNQQTRQLTPGCII